MDDFLAEMKAEYEGREDAFVARKKRIDAQHAATIARAREEQTPEGTLRRALAEVERDLRNA